MPRYGDLDALEKKLFPMGMVDDGRYALPAKAVKVAIDRLPTADVVAVVRCKDCEYFREDESVCMRHLSKMYGAGFCSLGGRKDLK